MKHDLTNDPPQAFLSDELNENIINAAKESTRAFDSLMALDLLLPRCGKLLFSVWFILSRKNKKTRIHIDDQGNQWLKISHRWIGIYAGIHKNNIRYSQTVLKQMNLIECATISEQGWHGHLHTATLWRLGKEFERFFELALMLRRAASYSDFKDGWEMWANDNLGIIEKYKKLIAPYRDFNVQVDFHRMQKVTYGADAKGYTHRKDNKKEKNCSYQNNERFFQKRRGEDMESLIDLGTKTRDANKTGIRVLDKIHQNHPNKKPKQSQKNIWVEYWNKNPYTPKLREGSKNYKRAGMFFDDFQKYKAGDMGAFILPPQEKERCDLQAINRRRGAHKARGASEMRRAIDSVALAFDPAYGPPDKAFLKNMGAMQFLFNDYGNTRPARSLFLEFFETRKPKPIEEYDNATTEIDDELGEALYDDIQDLYNRANELPENQPLSKADDQAARKVSAALCKAQMNFKNLGGALADTECRDFDVFFKWYFDFAFDHIWYGMPIQALAPDKKIWNKAIQWHKRSRPEWRPEWDYC